MKNKFVYILIIIALCQNIFALFAGPENVLLNDIAENIEKYKKKTITLKLKLKFIDKIFGRIIFYDSKSHNIEFDISSISLKKKLKLEIVNLHEGMDYFVTFTINGVGNYKLIIADLEKFKPVLLEKLP